MTLETRSPTATQEKTTVKFFLLSLSGHNNMRNSSTFSCQVL